MNLKELINLYQGRVDNEYEPGVIRGLLAEVLEDLNNLDEPTKIEIPAFADAVIKIAKSEGFTLFWAMNVNGKSKNFRDWIELSANQETFARAWIEGYEIKKETEKRYVVKLKELRDISSVLRYNKDEDYWEFGSGNEYGPFRTAHTRKELEKAKFGKVFDNPLFEVEEIKRKS